MADTFSKRQRAQKKKERKREKQERKQDRAASGGNQLTDQDINRMYFDGLQRGPGTDKADNDQPDGKPPE